MQPVSRYSATLGVDIGVASNLCNSISSTLSSFLMLSFVSLSQVSELKSSTEINIVCRSINDT